MILFFTFTASVFFLEFLKKVIMSRQIELTQSDAVRGASEACDQNVFVYIAVANERSNEEMRRMRKF